MILDYQQSVEILQDGERNWNSSKRRSANVQKSMTNTCPALKLPVLFPVWKFFWNSVLPWKQPLTTFFWVLSAKQITRKMMRLCWKSSTPFRQTINVFALLLWIYSLIAFRIRNPCFYYTHNSRHTTVRSKTIYRLIWKKSAVRPLSQRIFSVFKLNFYL